MAETILAKMAVELSANAAKFNQGIAQSQGVLKNLDGAAKGVTGTLNLLKGAAATLGLGLIGREIISVTSEFQKFEAVLKNTLGSNSAAQIALSEIEKFASATPFSVQELTSSFVKLANQGFKPTTDELRKLGDLASSTGKGFDQLTEAIIDAQVGEFERLKEFGIRAQKQGDQVKFTFKGVETQTKFTATAIRDYVLSLGDAEGVSGSMAAISKTLGGQISNLGDSWDILLKTIGDGNSGVLSGAIALLGQIIQKVTGLIKTNRQLQAEMESGGQAEIIKNLKELESITGDLDSAAIKLIASLEAEKEAIFEQAKPLFANVDANEKAIETLNNKALVIDAQIQAIKDYTDAEIKATAAEEASNKAKITSTGLIIELEKKLKLLEEQKRKSFSVEEITKFNDQMDVLKEKIDLLNASRTLSNFGKKQLINAELGLETKVPDLQDELTSGSGELRVEIPAPDIGPYLEALRTATDATVKLGAAGVQSYDQMRLAGEMQREEQERQSAAAMQFGLAIGDAFGDAISGEKTFAQAMKTLTKQIMLMFLQQALAAGIAGSFKTAKNPIIGAVLAGVATGVISAMFSKIGASGGGGSVGGGGISSTTGAENVRRTSIESQAQQITFDAEFTIKNSVLVAAVKQQENRSQQTG